MSKSVGAFPFQTRLMERVGGRVVQKRGDLGAEDEEVFLLLIASNFILP